MTKEAAINLSYLAAAELLKEAAEEEGVDLDALAANDQLDDEEVAEMLDETVVDLANAGELDELFEQVDEYEDELDADAEGYEDDDEYMEAEAEGAFLDKTAELLEKAAAKEKGILGAGKYFAGVARKLGKNVKAMGNAKLVGRRAARHEVATADVRKQLAGYRGLGRKLTDAEKEGKKKATEALRAAEKAHGKREGKISKTLGALTERLEGAQVAGSAPARFIYKHRKGVGAGAAAGVLGVGGAGYLAGRRNRG